MPRSASRRRKASEIAALSGVHLSSQIPVTRRGVYLVGESIRGYPWARRERLTGPQDKKRVAEGVQ